MLLGPSLGACAAPVSVPGAAARFHAPDGYTSLSQTEISIKYPASRAPANVVGNARRTTTIAFELKQEKLEPEHLPEAKAVFEQFFERIVPGLVWRQRKTVRLDGQNWIYLEFSSDAVDTDIHNIVLLTSRFGRLLLFNFNSTKAEFPLVESALRGSIQSIDLDLDRDRDRGQDVQ
jgi:hypothetical protein